MFLIDFWVPFLVLKKGPTFRSHFREALGNCNFYNEKWDHFLVPKTGPKNQTKIKKKDALQFIFFCSQRVFREAPPCDPTLRHCPLEFNSITRSTMLGFAISGGASRRRGGRLLYEHTDWRGGLRALIDRIINITIGSTCRRPIL